MLLPSVYPIVRLILWCGFLLFFLLMLLRMIFNYTDPNPFGKIGRFGFRIRKLTEKFVYPAARLFALYRIDTRLAPLVTILIALIVTYFTVNIIWNVCFVVDGLALGVISGNPKVFIGFVLYGLLSVLILFVFIRFLASWFVFAPNTLLGFVRRVTDPIMNPVERIIPRVGIFDISAMLVLILIGFLQGIVVNTMILP